MQQGKTLRSAGLLWWVVLTIVLAGVIHHFHGDVLKEPNSVLFAGKGDGLKNYFTYAWHAEHDKGALHFAGSGHPYGDHVFYTDGHPPLAWLVQWFPSLAPFKIGLLNVLLLLGLFPCAWALFGILRLHGLPPWAAAAAALGITLLQPQLYRLSGHLALAHCWVFPLTWYTLMRSRKDRSLGWTAATALIATLAILIHPYLGLMSVLFIVAFHAADLLFHWKERRKQWGTYVRPLLSGGLPIVVFLWLLRLSDVAHDRPEEQLGGEQFRTHISSLILPTDAPFSEFVDRVFHPVRPDWESLCYLGAATILVFIVLAFAEVRKLLLRRSSLLCPDELGIALFAAVLVLLFAMNIWQRALGDQLPSLSQFRATGRFAWVFYYVCTVFVMVRAYKALFQQSRLGRAASIVAFLILPGSMVLESWPRHANMASGMSITPNHFAAHEMDPGMDAIVDALRDLKADAIIPLPYVHIGSDKYLKDAPEALFALAYPAAYRSATPLMSGNMIRTSFSATRDLLALLAPASFYKRIERSMPNDSRFALLRSPDPLEPEEQQLWDRGTPLFQNERGSIRVIGAAELFRCDIDDRLEHFREHRSGMVRRGSWLLESLDSVASETLLASTFLQDDGAPLLGGSKDYVEVFDLPAGSLDTALTYEFDLVLRAIDPDAVNINIILEYEQPDGNMAWEGIRNLRGLPMQFGDRTLGTFTFRPKHTRTRYRSLLKGPDDRSLRYEVEHAILRPVTIDAWREGTWNGTATLFVNNIPLDTAAYLDPMNAR